MIQPITIANYGAQDEVQSNNVVTFRDDRSEHCKQKTTTANAASLSAWFLLLPTLPLPLSALPSHRLFLGPQR